MFMEKTQHVSIKSASNTSVFNPKNTEFQSQICFLIHSVPLFLSPLPYPRPKQWIGDCHQVS